MDYAQQLSALGATRKHVEFAEYLQTNTKGSRWPDFRSLDLMDVARLVPNIWVVDGRDGVEDGLPIHFSGTEIDHFFGRNLMGTSLRVGYAEYYSEQAFAAYCSTFTERRPVYIERSDYYPGVEPQLERRIKVALFPCSGDDEHIDFSVGLSTFEQTAEKSLSAPKFVQLDPPA